MFLTNYTELAAELITEIMESSDFKHINGEVHGVKFTDTVIGVKAAAEIQKQPGRYITLYTEEKDVISLVNALSVIISDVLFKGKCLVAGIGNPLIAFDALGWKTAGQVIATSGFLKTAEKNIKEGVHDVCVTRTDVAASSGIDTLKIIKAAADASSADYVICVDSVACSSYENLCRTIQITDAGMKIGKGAGKCLGEICADTIGRPVIAVGVPTVICGENAETVKLRRDIDISVKRFSFIIAMALNKSLLKKFDYNEIFELSQFG